MAIVLMSQNAVFAQSCCAAEKSPGQCLESGDEAQPSVPKADAGIVTEPPAVASAVQYRISRPGRQKLDTSESATINGEDTQPQMSPFDRQIDAYAHFQKWKEDYVRPVICPVLMCHGACASSELGCKGIYNSILGSANECCQNAPLAVHFSSGR